MSELRTTDLAEYIRWVGAFDFDRLPFRETDAVILCILSYFDFSGISFILSTGRP